MSALSYLALTIWHQGYPDQALRYHDEAVRIARVRNHANSIAYAESMRLLGLMLRGAHQSLFESATIAITFAEEKGLGYWSVFDRTLQAWTAARRDSTPEAVATMRRAFEMYRTTGAELPVVFRSMIADACLRAGDTQTATDEVNLALE